MRRVSVWRWAWVGLVLVLAALGCELSEVGGEPPTPIPAAGTPATPGGILTPEAQIAGLMSAPGEEHRYDFRGEAGMAVRIDMQAPRGGLLDSYLQLLGPDGQVLITDDDGGSSLNSLIEGFILPETGEYTIVASSYGSNSRGSYSLLFQMGTPQPTPTQAPTPIPGGGPIQFGQILTARLAEAGQVDLWTFEARQGDIITVQMQTNTPQYLDAYLELVSPGGLTLIVNDDGGSAMNARISNFILPETGTYTVRALGNGESRGNYTISLEAGVMPSPTPEPPTPGPTPTPVIQVLTLGQVYEGQILPRSSGNRYHLQIDEPILVEVRLELEDGPAGIDLDLRHPDSRRQSLTAFGTVASLVFLPDLFLEYPGEYAFAVDSSDLQPIRYTLLVRASELTAQGGGAIAYGQGVSGELLFASQQDHWTFEGRAGDVVTVLMSGYNMDSYLSLRARNGITLAQNDDVDGSGVLHARISQVTLPQDGEYVIVASSFRSGSFGPYRLMLFKEGE